MPPLISRRSTTAPILGLLASLAASHRTILSAGTTTRMEFPSPISSRLPWRPLSGTAATLPLRECRADRKVTARSVK